MYTPRTPRIVSARRLQRRRDRDAAGRFLAEGPQAVREALAAGAVLELFGTPAGLDRHAELAAQAPEVSPVTDDALAALAETVQPQGLVALCEQVDVPIGEALAKGPQLVAVLAEIRDPGNAGTILRTADAAGAGTVIFAGDAVDPYNGKCVRASAGSLFHVDVVRAPLDVLDLLQDSGLQVLATSGTGSDDVDSLLDGGLLAAPTAWLFGSEAHGLPGELLDAADRRVRVPIYGGAESLNLAAAAAVCLYASARAQR
ncbi:RNA methyltransferase [Actinoplanes sp. SE50]|uniref:TrmH family RNA methyltransferase n=1 Tax=unclassified Actinoplanes TaxID=2626549 RepID=UPI00023ED4E0|nr:MULTISPECIES: RNA methyltransferase [unclassified Actinoplanes]AEV87325.1 RNA methyltransferase, TrmH family [Actinoplanes sp. SE50/110]ATO85725.1 RNA methyltransferase [Actinoplanes sp. SE50]SLM03138.1 RNA methyltransferase [Actinoplanes sp. SE50/110]